MDGCQFIVSLQPAGFEVGDTVYYMQTREIGVVNKVLCDTFLKVQFAQGEPEKIAICNISKRNNNG